MNALLIKSKKDIFPIETNGTINGKYWYAYSIYWP